MAETPPAADERRSLLYPCPACGGTGGGSIIVSWGRWGGVNVTGKASVMVRLCLGWVALTWVNRDFDCLLRYAMDNDFPAKEAS